MFQNHEIFDQCWVLERELWNRNTHDIFEYKYKQNNLVARSVIDRKTKTWKDSSINQKLHNQLECINQIKCIPILQIDTEWSKDL